MDTGYKNLDEIKNLRELRDIRSRMAWEAEHSEEKMRESFDGYKSMFSVSSITSALFSPKALGVEAIAVAATTGVSLISSFIKRRKNKKRSKKEEAKQVCKSGTRKERKACRKGIKNS